MRAVGDKTSKYPHNPITIKEIEFIKLAVVAFIFFFTKIKILISHMQLKTVTIRIFSI